MNPVMPHVSVPGDNEGSYTINGVEIRPRIMARNGQLRGIDTEHGRTVWCFGFSPASEAAAAYQRVHTPMFYWVLADFGGAVIDAVADLAAIELPEHFRAVIDWTPEWQQFRDRLDELDANDSPEEVVGSDEPVYAATGAVVPGLTKRGDTFLIDGKAVTDADADAYMTSHEDGPDDDNRPDPSEDFDPNWMTP